MYSIKPVDKDTIINCAKQTDKLVSIEDHSVIGGIGSIVANVLCESYPKRLVKLGLQDRFGKSGNPDKLYEMYGITCQNIIDVFYSKTKGQE
ncbi:MAG: transketolase C-terminal domain-containing protein [Clostridia bacterium]